jgi:hypothetical protein
VLKVDFDMFAIEALFQKGQPGSVGIGTSAGGEQFHGGASLASSGVCSGWPTDCATGRAA